MGRRARVGRRRGLAISFEILAWKAQPPQGHRAIDVFHLTLQGTRLNDEEAEALREAVRARFAEEHEKGAAARAGAE